MLTVQWTSQSVFQVPSHALRPPLLCFQCNQIRLHVERFIHDGDLYAAPHVPLAVYVLWQRALFSVVLGCLVCV